MLTGRDDCWTRQRRRSSSTSSSNCYRLESNEEEKKRGDTTDGRDAEDPRPLPGDSGAHIVLSYLSGGMPDEKRDGSAGQGRDAEAAGHPPATPPGDERGADSGRVRAGQAPEGTRPR